MCFSHVYDNVGVKVNRHIYENPGELSDVTPDLILAVKPKVPLQEEGQVRKCSHTNAHENTNACHLGRFVVQNNRT